MHRLPLLELLDRYRPAHPDEDACVARVCALVEGHRDCFDRRCMPGHVTASAWIASHDGERFLLTHHRKLDRWLQLGGHADGDPDVQSVALREAREESGMERFEFVVARHGGPLLDVDVHTIPARPGEPEHEHHDLRFLLVAAANQRLSISDESNHLRWFAWSELGDLGSDESVLRLARKARSVLASSGLREESRSVAAGAGTDS